MKIKFTLQGVERVIVQDSPTSYKAEHPGSQLTLGYYSTLQNAVLSHIRNAAIIDEKGKEEVIELKDYIARLEKLLGEIRGMPNDDIKKFASFEEKTSGISEEKVKKMTQGRAKVNKAVEASIQPEPTNAFDGF